MQPIPQNIADFFRSNHVVSIAAAGEGRPWCACCFYVFDEARATLIVLTSRNSRHGALMLDNPQVAGTVAGQPQGFAQISGIQLSARAECLTDKEQRAAALSRYTAVHPLAKAMALKTDVWLLFLENVKFTDNKLVFAQKTHWQREEG
ncbi:MAG: pyridoxamine 5'-phosphate oxidase family protein [Neisseria sp.]|nr:pyridoxamine 5'-phosphate oxidase family protein [Neisseria sp.]